MSRYVRRYVLSCMVLSVEPEFIERIFLLYSK